MAGPCAPQAPHCIAKAPAASGTGAVSTARQNRQRQPSSDWRVFFRSRWDAGSGPPDGHGV